MRFSDAPGHMRETEHEALMERVDEQGRVVGFSILGSSYRKRMCQKRCGPERPLAAPCAGIMKMFLDMLGCVGFASPVPWQPTHQLNELLDGGSGFRLRQSRA